MEEVFGIELDENIKEEAEYNKRLESNKTVDEAMRKKGFIMFTFDKNIHKIDITTKEYEEVKIRVIRNKEYEFGLDDIYARKGDFAKLLKDMVKTYDGITIIRYENVFKFEKFVGEKLEEKKMFEHMEVEEYITKEELLSVYFKALS